MSLPSLGDIIATLEAADVSIGCVDGEIVTPGPVPDAVAQLLVERRQDVAVALMTIRGDYAETNCAHELRVLKAIQGCIVSDIAALEAVSGVRLAVERAYQALADVPRLAKNFRWLAVADNAASPDFVERLRWAGYASLRLIAAGAELDRMVRPPARQEALFEAL